MAQSKSFKTMLNELAQLQSNLDEVDKNKLASVFYEFATAFVDLKKQYNTSYQREEHIAALAEELYFRSIKSPIEFPMAYAKKCYTGICAQWAYDNGRAMPRDKQRIADTLPYRPLRYTPSYEQVALERSWINELVWELFKYTNKYIKYSQKYSSNIAKNDAHMTLLFSIIHGEYTPFRLTGFDAAYTRLIFNKYREAFVKILESAQVGHQMSDEEFTRAALLEIGMMNGMFDEDN